jgi:hypothetical protein
VVCDQTNGGGETLVGRTVRVRGRFWRAKADDFYGHPGSPGLGSRPPQSSFRLVVHSTIVADGARGGYRAASPYDAPEGVSARPPQIESDASATALARTRAPCPAWLALATGPSPTGRFASVRDQEGNHHNGTGAPEGVPAMHGQFPITEQSWASSSNSAGTRSLGLAPTSSEGGT